MKLIAVLTTTESREEAEKIATSLVEQRLAACAQISAIESVYSWKGQVQQESEYRLFIKTTRDRYAEVEAAILELHSYELPAIYAIELGPVFEPYTNWVAENARTPA